MKYTGKIPRHIAVIMDGNGRWAQSRGHPRVYGHVRGTARAEEIIREASNLGVQALTLFAFSTENWQRPAGELQVLWKLLKKYLMRKGDELFRENVVLRVIGEVERMSPDLRAVLDPLVKRLEKNTGLQLTIAFSYGSRREIERAMQLFAGDCMAGRRRPEDLDETIMKQYLWTSVLGDLADVDLLIRTSGERRISNFLLWQSAYAELFFSDLYWPEFGPANFRRAIEEFGNRERRFGRVSPVELVPQAAGGLNK